MTFDSFVHGQWKKENEEQIISLVISLMCLGTTANHKITNKNKTRSGDPSGFPLLLTVWGKEI